MISTSPSNNAIRMLTSRAPFGFQQLLITLLLFLLLPGIAGPNLSTLLPFMFSVVLISSLYLVARDRRQLIIGCLLALPPLLTNFDLGFMEDTLRTQLNLGLQVIFLVYVCRHLFAYLLAARQVQASVIYGALCLYLIIGFIWAFIFTLLESLDPGAIGVAGESINNFHFVELLYFSFVTITTLGYGDISPVSQLAQSFAVIEAVTGQIYLAVIIARLVGMQISDGMR